MEIEELEKRLNELYSKLKGSTRIGTIEMATVNVLYEEIDRPYRIAKKLREIVMDYKEAEHKKEKTKERELTEKEKEEIRSINRALARYYETGDSHDFIGE